MSKLINTIKYYILKFIILDYRPSSEAAQIVNTRKNNQRELLRLLRGILFPYETINSGKKFYVDSDSQYWEAKEMGRYFNSEIYIKFENTWKESKTLNLNTDLAVEIIKKEELDIDLALHELFQSLINDLDEAFQIEKLKVKAEETQRIKSRFM
ncbi:MAG: hypothetical protein MK175_02220 [Pseudoalteromonas sp.]|uniref:hypothetical protein n=1 Tax=Pseudoalteromonas sp. TaxID=53249 RepID=UPI0025D9A04D|nr:hypothetical protein [Pseudoalteromonas sp.]MCH2085975.1 hypothetical protein [Pseudoalteromonas sp.]